jgi:hypothetical protein
VSHACPDPALPIVFTKHADKRLRERFGIFNLDRIRDEITNSLLAQRFEHRARNIWLIHGDGRDYPVAVRQGLVIVMTAYDPFPAEAAA